MSKYYYSLKDGIKSYEHIIKECEDLEYQVLIRNITMKGNICDKIDKLCTKLNDIKTSDELNTTFSLNTSDFKDIKWFKEHLSCIINKQIIITNTENINNKTCYLSDDFEIVVTNDCELSTSIRDYLMYVPNQFSSNIIRKTNRKKLSLVAWKDSIKQKNRIYRGPTNKKYRNDIRGVSIVKEYHTENRSISNGYITMSISGHIDIDFEQIKSSINIIPVGSIMLSCKTFTILLRHNSMQIYPSSNNNIHDIIEVIRNILDMNDDDMCSLSMSYYLKLSKKIKYTPIIFGKNKLSVYSDKIIINKINSLTDLSNQTKIVDDIIKTTNDNIEKIKTLDISNTKLEYLEDICNQVSFC